MEEEQQQASSSKSPMLLVGIGVIVLIAIGAFVLVQSQNKNAAQTTQNESMMKEDSMQKDKVKSTDSDKMEGNKMSSTEGAMDNSKVDEFTVHGGMFYFKSNTLTVKKGDTVKIHFVNDEGTHDWNLDEFNAHSGVISTGKTADVQFVADKAGTFEYYCSVGNHRQMGMVGKLTVTE